MSFECGQQRVMRLGWERPGSPASRRVLTNRMREYFTYGSVGGAGGNPGSYPALSRILRLDLFVGFLFAHGFSAGESASTFGGIMRMALIIIPTRIVPGCAVGALFAAAGMFPGLVAGIVGRLLVLTCGASCMAPVRGCSRS